MITPIRDNGRVNDADQDTPDTSNDDLETLDISAADDAVDSDDSAGASKGSRLYPRVTSFRSRRGSLTTPQQDAWDRMWPKIGRDVGDDLIDTTAWFERDAPLIVEIVPAPAPRPPRWRRPSRT